MQGEHWQRPRIPCLDQLPRLSGRRRAAQGRYFSEGAPDGAQVFDELVGDEQRLAVQALDQLAQPVDFLAVDEHRIVGARVVEKAVSELRQLPRRDQW